MPIVVTSPIMLSVVMLSIVALNLALPSVAAKSICPIKEKQTVKGGSYFKVNIY